MKLLCALLILIPACLVAAEETEYGVTIYNQGFAVVRDTITLELRKGLNRIEFTEATAHVEPQSVILRDAGNRHVFQILEQNYRSDPVSQELLLSLYEGKTIQFIVDQQQGKTVSGKIIRSGYVPHRSAWNRYGNEYQARQVAFVQGSAGQPIVEVDGALRFSLPGIPLFPGLSDDAITQPTLAWLISSEEDARFAAEISYLTGGMSWEADYNIVAPEEGDVLDLIGWVTFDNQSGKSFSTAKIKLVAGDVSKLQTDQRAIHSMVVAQGYAGRGPAVSERTFDEYHLYDLERPVDLKDRETKQVEFLRGSGLKSTRMYVYDGVKIDRSRYSGWNASNYRDDRNYGAETNRKVWVMREFQNSKENHLGIALPKGSVRFYRKDKDGRLEFVGENVIDHTPRDETIRVYTGDAFDLVGERVRQTYNINHSEMWLDESFEIHLRNHKKETVEIRVVEHLYRWTNWEIRSASNTYLKTDSQTIEFRVQIKPDEEKVINYTAHYTW